MGTPRDYYADLELSPTADLAEIKKQFRKLALKYHPDRNPGREQEVNAKFQIIQTAHEILSDPEQKAKHDAARTRSRYPTASGVRGNPWANAGDQFPPPPRRGQPTRATPSGAQRWQTRFSQGVPPTAKQAAADPEMKKNAARAFENMRKGNAKPNEQPRPNAPPPPPRTESAKQRAQASFGTRKTGYYPRSASNGDEPPVASNNYNTAYASRPVPEPPAQEYSYPSRPGQAPMADPLRQFREQADPRQSSPYTSHTGEKTNPFDNVPLSRAKSAREPPRTDTSSPEVDSPTRQRSFSVPKTKDGDDSVPGSQTADSPSKVPLNARPKLPLKKTRTGQKLSTAPGSSATAPPKTAVPEAGQSQKNAHEPSIFNIPISDDTFAPNSPEQHTFSRSSTDDINTRFVEEEEPDSWQFSAGGSEQNTPTKPRPTPGSRTGRRSPGKRPAVSRSDTSSVPSESGNSEQTGFDAEGWRKEFGPHTFVPPPPQTKSVSPTRSMRANSKKGRSIKTPGAGAVSDESSSEEEELAWPGRKLQQGGPVAAESPQAMDIDSPPVKTSTPTAAPRDKTESSNGARNINVEPSRPEWRPGNAEGVNGNAKPPVPEKVPFNPNAVGSEDSEEFLASVSDLKNVAPFAQQTSGLKSMTDLKDNLPFESKPSVENPVRIPKAPPLLFPDAPLAPPLPTVSLNGRKPHVAAWEKYVQDFEFYLQRWDEFNARVVEHFATRKTNIASMRKSKGYSFLESRNDAAIQEYFSWVQQDGDVRRQWSAACEEHEKRFKEFMAFRMRMK